VVGSSWRTQNPPNIDGVPKTLGVETNPAKANVAAGGAVGGSAEDEGYKEKQDVNQRFKWGRPMGSRFFIFHITCIQAPGSAPIAGRKSSSTYFRDANEDYS
jgi:hypothetical protein